MVLPTLLRLQQRELSAKEDGLNHLWNGHLTRPDGQDAHSTKITAYLILLPKETSRRRSLRQSLLRQKLRLRRLTMALMGGIVVVSLQMGTPSSAIASAPPSAMPAHPPPKSSQFQTLEQPFWVKAIVTAGGLSLIGLELWWFLFSKPSPNKHTP